MEKQPGPAITKFGGVKLVQYQLSNWAQKSVWVIGNQKFDSLYPQQFRDLTGRLILPRNCRVENKSNLFLTGSITSIKNQLIEIDRKNPGSTPTRS